MKKLIFGLLAIFLLATTVEAQDAKKLEKNAKRALGTYRMDNSNKDKMKEAIDEVNELSKLELPDEDKASAAMLRGDIYNELATQINTARQLNLNTAEGLPEVETPALEAAQAYKDALKFATKKYETKDALKGLAAVQSNLNAFGIKHYEEENDYKAAYKCFNGLLQVHDILKENGEESILSAEADYLNQVYLASLAAVNAGMNKEAKEHLQMLYDKNFEKATIYESLYKIASDEEGPDEAYRYLEEGRKRFPDEVSLLFAEINHFLKLKKQDVLIEKLKLAIEKEPGNASLYSVLGSTYNNLQSAALKAGDDTKADEYLNEALANFNKALEVDPKNILAVYSIGEIYYNRAALKTQQMQKYASDYSKEGMKKYEDLRKEVFEEFDKALPYFQKAESIDPNDLNTLIALKEIYAKKDDLKMSEEFKNRLETVQGGGKNENPYFNE